MQANSYNKGNRPCDPTGNRRSNSRVNCVKWATGYDGVGNRTQHRKYASEQNHKDDPTMIKLCSWNARKLK